MMVERHKYQFPIKAMKEDDPRNMFYMKILKFQISSKR